MASLLYLLALIIGIAALSYWRYARARSKRFVHTLEEKRRSDE